MRIEFIVEKHEGFFKVTEKHDGTVMSVTRHARSGALFPSNTGRAMMINSDGIIGAVPHQEPGPQATGSTAPPPMIFSWRE